jgi:uncharacterized protein involved in exopolysaccharide biosynthesis/Mrp family chromosome partitioning ATPase
MRASNTKADDIDVMGLVGAVRRNLPKIALFTILAGALTYAGLSMMAPRYVSDTQIAIVPKSTNPFPDGKRDGQPLESITPRVDKEAINTHVRALGATDLVLQIAEKLELQKRAEFNPAVGDVDQFSTVLRLVGLGGVRPGQTPQDRMLETVYKQLEIGAARETRYINVRFSSTDPQLAAAFANALAAGYREKLVTVPVKETSDVVSALEPKVEQLRREVLDAESAVEAYRAETDQFRGGAQGTPVNDQRMGDLNIELTKADAARAESESRWRTARDLAALDSADILPEVQRSQLIQSLINQRIRLERQIAEASASLLPAHPRMRELAAQIGGLKGQIKAEIGKLVQSLEKESRAASVRVEQIRAGINSLKSTVVNTSGNEAQLKALESTARSKRTELEALQKQLENNRTLQATKAVPIEAQIVSAARATSVPVWPKKAPWTGMASLAAFLLGCVAVVTSAIANHGRPPKRKAASKQRSVVKDKATAKAGAKAAEAPVKDADAVRAKPESVPASTTLDGELPEGFHGSDRPTYRNMSWDELARGMTDGDRLDDAGVDPIHELAYRLIDRGAAAPGYRTMITGATPLIDGTIEALEVASVLRAQGRLVVYVDWNLDGQGLSTQFGLEGRAGLTDLISGRAQLSDVVAKMPGTDIHVIPCGPALGDDEAALDADQIANALDTLDEHYHHIVVSGSHQDSRDLFQAIQGRFDCGVSISERTEAAARPNVFLGFEVADIDVVHHAREAEEPLTGSATFKLGAGEARP